ncbi:MAG: glycosyltransferase [Acidobacteriota bacterium]|nr:glycosyltransferase [Acidobacteriota bacterium]
MSDSRILIPVYEDWAAVTRLIKELDATGRRCDVLLIDDGSVSPRPAALAGILGAGAVEVLRLRRNLGHQRAIAIGLAYLEANGLEASVVIMDGDGEDRPADVPRLLDAAETSGGSIVFAERTRRSEGWLFSVLYHTYRGAHWVLTGERVRVGNFSAIPASLLPRLVAVSDLWNHYAAAVFKSRLPFMTIPTDRGVRYAGQPKMNYVALVTHGLSAMAAFGDRIGVRLLTATVLVGLVAGAALAFAVVRPLLSGGGVPGWAPMAILLFFVVIFQALAVSLTFVFVILGSRDSSTFIPLRDYKFYVLDVTTIRAPHR